MRTFVATVTHWDVVFLTRIIGWSGRKFVASVLPWVSHTGNGYYYPAVPLFVYLIEPQLGCRFFISAIIAFSLELPIYKILKNSIRRDRPCEALQGIAQGVSPGDRFSFPSGHTAAAFIIALLISHFLPIFTVPSFAWAILVGLSRVYLGVHYPTDILAGIVLGVLSGWVGIISAH